MSMILTATEYAMKALNVAQNYKTSYIWGGIGSPITEETIARCIAAYQKNTTNGYAAKARALLGVGFMFDCVGLVKSLLWGWSGDASKTYGGATYTANGVPDTSADQMIQKCAGVSTDFAGIAVGEALWMTGHIGIYVGGGKAVECTPAWTGGVQISTVLNVAGAQIAGTAGTRRWTKHGKLPWVDYTVKEEETMSGKDIIAALTDEQAWQLVEKANRHAATLKPSEYAETACAKGVTSGLFSDGNHDGLVDNPQAFVKRQELATVLDRRGLLEKGV